MLERNLPINGSDGPYPTMSTGTPSSQACGCFGDPSLNGDGLGEGGTCDLGDVGDEMLHPHLGRKSSGRNRGVGTR